MAQRRMLSRVIGQSRKLAKISLKSALLYTWMIPFLDDYGRYEAMPDTIKSEVTRYRKDFSEKTIRSCLEELADERLIVFYDKGGYTYFEQVNFDEHQTFKNDRERRAEFPIPPWGNSNRKFDFSTGKFVPSNCPTQVEEEDKEEVEEEGEAGILSSLYSHWSESVHPITSQEGWDMRKLYLDCVALTATLQEKFPKEKFNNPEDNIHEEIDTLVEKYSPDKHTVKYLRGMLNGKAKEAYGYGLGE